MRHSRGWLLTIRSALYVVFYEEPAANWTSPVSSSFLMVRHYDDSSLCDVGPICVSMYNGKVFEKMPMA